MGSDKLLEIYQMAIAQPELNERLQTNCFDISWLQSRLEKEDYINLEEIIFDYGNKNDEILFKAGFQYAWKLFLQCNK